MDGSLGNRIRAEEVCIDVTRGAEHQHVICIEHISCATLPGISASNLKTITTGTYSVLWSWLLENVEYLLFELVDAWVVV
jgi:hypothetical protein